MSPGEQLAQRLTAMFLEGGNFVSTPPMKAEKALGVEPAASSRREGNEFEESFEDSFAGLAVQAVGFEKGGEREAVHIYVSRGGRKVSRKVQEAGEDVRVEVNRIGKLVVRPDQASSKTHRGNLYMRTDR